MHTNDSKWLQPVLSTIANYDPGLAAEIHQSDATITIVSDPWTMLMGLVTKLPMAMAQAMLQSMANASGLTVRPPQDAAEAAETPELAPVYGDVWLRRDAIEDSARSLGVSWEHFAAATLVHEWKHHNGYGETEGYDAGAEFARRMGDETLAKAEEDTKVRGVAYEREVSRRADAERARGTW